MTAELPQNCPTCDREIDGIETRAPSDHRLAPCGCAADFGPSPTSEPQPVADGGVSWSDLTGFQRDMLLAIYQMDQPKGLAVKAELERVYGEDVNHGQLYPNLDTLVDHQLVEKGELDRRTNYYEITAGGRALIEETAQVFASATSKPQIVTDGGVSWFNLTGFQLNLLREIIAMNQPSGQAIRRRLEASTGEDINHGRLYPNLDQLVDYQLVEKGDQDQRTNYYDVTTSGRMLAEQIADDFDRATTELVAADGGQR